MLVSVIQQPESVITVHISPPSSASPPPHAHPAPPGHRRAPAGLPVLCSSFPLASSFKHDSVNMSLLLS